VLERVVPVAPSKVWAAWTDPKHIVHWFTPSPWSTTKAEVDLRPGGRFFTVMRSPEGQEFPNEGCFLEVVPEKRLVWTNALLPGWRPAPLPKDDHCGHFHMTAAILLEPEGKGTRYTAHVLHQDEAGRKSHEEMGFRDGWGKALDQLVAHMSKAR
jgi:uncharacterized protein YndB with AHSA1/START domain